METFPVAGYYMAGGDGSDGGSNVSLDTAAAAKEADKTDRSGRVGGDRRAKGLRRSPKSPKRLKQKGRANSESDRDEPVPRSPAGELERTKRLLMAALRVWELKRGIR